MATRFVRIHGRVVPLRGNSQNKRSGVAPNQHPLLDAQDKRDIGIFGAAVGVAALGALAAGRLAPPSGLAQASPKVRKMVSFKLAKIAGLTSFLGMGVATGTAGHFAERKQQGAGSATGAIVGAGLSLAMPKVARLGRMWSRASAYRRAFGGSKAMMNFSNMLGGAKP